MLWEPFKVTAPSRTAVGNSETNCQQRTEICQRPFIYYIQLLTIALRTIWNLFQWRNEHFKPGMILFFVGNGARNPLLYWQRLNELSEMLAMALWTLRNDACSVSSKRMGNSVPPLKKSTQVPSIPMARWISLGIHFRKLPRAVRDGAVT